MALGAIVLGAALGFASVKFKVEGDPLVEKIDAILPQTQCGQCGYPGCKPYAEAAASGEAGPNLCIPGGNIVAQGVADLLGVEFQPVGGEGGEIKPKVTAFVNEHLCIGCTACLKACPVDSIIGGTKSVHTIVKSACTGCELCEPACPVEGCIVMEPIEQNIGSWKWEYPDYEVKKAA
jgi:electron transport complex protein RnfB